MSAALGRVLVVDDTEMNRDLLARRLGALGHDVVLAPDGAGALAVLAAQPIDLVLLDIMMPGMDGYTVLERVRADPELSRIPIVMISAVDEIESVARCIELGAADYLPKPFNPIVLKARVNATLARKRFEDGERLRARSLERELEIGRGIQRDFLPDSLPGPSGWELAAVFQPARQVSGDFYDAFTLEDGRIGLVVADVCDKGVGAALFMALFRSLIRSHAELHGAGTPAAPAARSIVALTNDYIARTHGRSNMFATIFFGILDPASGALAWVNGGHEPPLVRRRSGALERLAPTGPAVGMLTASEYEARTTDLAPGDLLLAFTDGVTEERSPAGELYGENRLLSLATAAAPTAAGVLQGLAQAVAAFRGETEPSDDVTMLAVRRL